MQREQRLEEKYGRDAGFRVPDGYFEQLQAAVMERLPEYPEKPRAVELSRWQRLKPYVYMAAMFAGIWLMMNLFHRVSGYGDLNLENPPATVALAMASTQEDYPNTGYSVNDYELVDDVAATYDDIADFETEFGYSFKPEYASLDTAPDSPQTVSI